MKLTPYIQINVIANKDLTPITLIHLWMPIHKENIHIILNTGQIIEQTLLTHSTHFSILIGDFS